MSTPFDYSKWDKIELSDDEADVHPNIERESWFRMKHRARVEREEKEEQDKKRIREEMASSDLRIKEIQKLLEDIDKQKGGDSDDDDDDLEDRDGLLAELEELKGANKARQAKLDDYEKHKKWNVDNMCHVVEEKTIITSSSGTPRFSEKTGYALAEDEEDVKPTSVNKSVVTEMGECAIGESKDSGSSSTTASKAAASSKVTKEASVSSKTTKKPAETGPKPAYEDSATMSMMSYAHFTEKYVDILEHFLSIQSMDQTKDYLLLNGSVLLQENASSYLLLACLEDEMNGKHDKMRLVARQSQILTNIAELAKTLRQHPGNVITPFFKRMEEREHLHNFLEGVEGFVEKVKARAIVKRKEMEASRAKEEEEEYEEVDLQSIPLEKRLGPGGLDPVEVFESLPRKMQEAFESREVEKLKEALMEMDPKDAEYHLQRCIDSGLWNEGGGDGEEEE